MIEFHLGAPNYPVLEAYWECRDPVSFIIGPLGSGKTYASVQRMLRQMFEQEPNAQGDRLTRWICIRNTYRDLTSTTIRDFQAVCGELGTMTMGGSGPPLWRGHFKIGDGTRVRSEVEFIALELEADVRRLRGVQTTGAWLNEARELARSTIDMTDLRVGRYPSIADGGIMPSWAGMFGDMNAFDTEHWLYPLIEAPPSGWRFFIQPGGVRRVQDRWVVNPDAENLANLRANYYGQGVEGKREDWIRVNLANEFIFNVEGQPVHPEYVDRVHTFSETYEVKPGSQLYLGADFGRTPAVAVIHHDEVMGRYRILGEQTTADSESAVLFAPRVKAWLDRRWPGCRWKGWGDPAGDAQGQATESTPLEILRAHGIPFEAAPTNNPLLRRAAITNPLTRLCMDGRPALLVHEDAKMIRRGLMGGFHYRRVQVPGTERFMDVPEKNRWSHPVESLEYGLLGLGEGHLSLIPASLPKRKRETKLPDRAEMM